MVYDGKVLKPLQEGESYKSLGILVADRFLEEVTKLKVSREYLRRLRKVLKSQLNGGNLVQGVNTWAVSLFRYSAAFISWKSASCGLQIRIVDSCLQYMGDCTQSLMLIKDCINLEKFGGRGLIAIEDCVKVPTRHLEVYVP